MGFENVVVDDLAKKAEGRLKAAVLVQKRVRELERGWPALVAQEGRGLIQTAVAEFQAGLVELVTGEEADELRDRRVVEERERVRQIEAQRRAAEAEAAANSQSGRAAFGAPAPVKS